MFYYCMQEYFSKNIENQRSSMANSLKISMKHAKILPGLHAKFCRKINQKLNTFQVITLLHINKVVLANCDFSTNNQN